MYFLPIVLYKIKKQVSYDQDCDLVSLEWKWQLFQVSGRWANFPFLSADTVNEI